MVASLPHRQMPARAFAGMAALGLFALLTGCAGLSDGMTSAFADPAKYDLYNCKQLETERKGLTSRLAELQGLMNKAQEGAAGVVVAEVAYRNEYIAIRGQLKNANEAWAINKCVETPDKPAATPAPVAADKSGSKANHALRSGSAIY